MDESKYTETPSKPQEKIPIIPIFGISHTFIFALRKIHTFIQGVLKKCVHLCFCHSLASWMPTFFNSPPCAKSKNDSTFILGLKLAD